MVETPLWMFCMELGFSWLFMYQFFLELYMAKVKLHYIQSLQAMVDLVTVTPVMLMAATGGYTGGSAGFLRFTRVMKVTRVFRLVRLVRSIQVLSNPIDDAISAQIVELTSTLLSMIVIAAGFVQFLDSSGNCFDGDLVAGVCPSPLAFHDAFYFTIVTFSTVGYGDMSPVDTTGRMVMVVMIIMFIYLIPVETGKLTTLMEMRSRYDGKAKLGKNSIHVVLCCDENCTGVDSFLQQFFHEDHGLLHSHMIVLCPAEPDHMWRSMLLKYKKRITYLKGDFIKHNDLVRAQVEGAVGCFIMADRFCTDTNAQDAKNILRGLTLWSYNRKINCFIQLIEPENRKHLLQVGIPASRVICHNEIKMGLMAQGCLWRGFSTLVANLLCVTTSDEFDISAKWEEEYVKGAQQEVYRGPLGVKYIGRPFTDAVKDIYASSGVLLIAICNQKMGAVLNPGRGYKIKADDFGFLIADNHEVISKLLEPELKPRFMLSNFFGSGAAPVLPEGILGSPEGRGSLSDDMVTALARGGGRAVGKGRNPKAVKEALMREHETAVAIAQKVAKAVTTSPWYRSLVDAMQEYEKAPVPVSGHYVVLCPSLDDIGALLEMIRLPHLCKRAVVLVTPIHLLEKKKDIRETEIDWEEIMAFEEIHLVCGCHDDTNTLYRAAVDKAHAVMIFSNRAETADEDQSFVDSALILTALGVFAELQHDRRVLVELNDTTVIEHFGCVTRSVVERAHNVDLLVIEEEKQPVSPTRRNSVEASALTRGLSVKDTGLAKIKAKSETPKRKNPKAANSEGQSVGDGERVVVNRQHQLNPAYLSGDVVVSNVSSLLLCQAFFNPHIIGIISILVGAIMEEEDEGADDMAKASMVQIKLPNDFMESAEKHVTRGLVQWRFSDVFDYMMKNDVLPVALYRLGSESRDSLHLDVGPMQREVMPTNSFLITNPLPDQMVGEHDLLCVLIYSRDTYNRLRMLDEPFKNSFTPYSHEGRRRSRVEMNTMEAAGKFSAGAAINSNVQQLHKSVDALIGAGGGAGANTVSSDFTQLQESVDALVTSTVKKDMELLEMRQKLNICQNALKDAEGSSTDESRMHLTSA
jgi:hypothetical protein